MPREVASLTIDVLAPPPHPGGVLSIHATLADSLPQPTSDANLPLFVSTSGGDLERTSLASRFCPVRLEGGFQHECLGLFIRMQPDQDVRSIEPQLRAWGARFTLVAPRLQFASALIVGRPASAQRMKEIERWPGVQSAFFSGRPAFAFGAPQVALSAMRQSTLAIENSPVRVDDGVVQAVPGDTIYLSYRQPSGAMLMISTIVQPPPTDQCWFFPAPC